ncbi:hypothetical protein DPMN_161657 [Dreissena polymorpha]|uniref:Uncharacterized protein n=1 Tax=Dreissena polymorpha TaxID=45954 RepID=A0A9D4EN30_DREPO|nr:hypothetical protein DPMN_161657 [Dreissena polymorpha]
MFKLAQTNQQTDRQGKNNMSPTTILSNFAWPLRKAPNPPPSDQTAGRANTPTTEQPEDQVATPVIRKRKRSGSQDPPEWFRSYMKEHIIAA